MTELFRFGFPSYRKNSVFRDKVEIVLDRSGAVIGATNSDMLVNLTIPACAEELALTEIADRAFMGLMNLKTASVEKGVEEIGNEAFKDCSTLLAVTIPDTVYRIGAGAFENCSSLRAFDIPLGVEILGSRAFCGCSSLMSVLIPDSVRAIGAMAFASAKSLRSAKLPCSLEEIPDGLFMDSGIERIEIPSSVRRIGSAAFSRARNLREIYFSGTLKEFRRISFGLHWNNGIQSSASLFLRDNNGRYYNAFSETSGDKTDDERKEKALAALGLSAGCTRKDIEAAFRKKAKHFHPDVLSGKDLDPEFAEFAAARFRELQEAESYLLDNC